MAKIQSPLLGYNNNVRHKNRVFHIQTEDSGVKHPHVITHLFMDGGRILKSVKRSYAEHVGSDSLSETVRQLMKEQHKAMFIALRDGEYDHLLEVAPIPSSGQTAVAKAPLASAPTASAAPVKEESGRRDVREVQASQVPSQAPGPAGPSVQPGPAVQPGPHAPAVPFSRNDSKTDVAVTSAKAPETSRDMPPGIDMQAIEAASLTTGERAAMSISNDLPPPPKNLFQKELTGNIGYRSTHVDDEEASRGVQTPVKRPASSPPLNQTRRSNGSTPAPEKRPHGRTQPSVAPPPTSPLHRPSVAPISTSKPIVQPAQSNASSPPPTQKDTPKDDPAKSRRYAPARPAAIFGQTQAPSSSIFGDDLVGDKSLDEVILSYLVDDLSPPKKP